MGFSGHGGHISMLVADIDHEIHAEVMAAVRVLLGGGLGVSGIV